MRIGALLLTIALLGVTSLPAQQSPTAHQKPAAKKAATEVVVPAQAAAPAEQPVNSGAQSTELSTAVDSVAVSTAEKPKGKGGLFGKAKKLAKSKVVQTVAKTAACTMVPGGQAIAGAIDAAAAKSAGEAAQGAASAATGSSCMPGMGGAGMAGAGMAGMGGTGMAGAASMAGASALSALVGGAMPGGAPMSAAQMQQMQMMSTAPSAGYAGMGVPDEAETAGCLGVTVEEYRQFSNPTGGVNRPMTKAEMKQQSKIGKKIQGRQQACAMQQMAQAMAMSQQAMATSQQRMAAANAENLSEAPGKAPAIATDLVAELKKGKTALREIDWVAGGVAVSEAGAPGFDATMVKLAGAMQQAGGSYRIDIYMDQRYGDSEVKTLGPSRIAAVQQGIENATVGSPVKLKAGSSKKAKDARVEIVRAGGR